MIRCAQAHAQEGRRSAPRRIFSRFVGKGITSQCMHGGDNADGHGGSVMIHPGDSLDVECTWNI